METLNLDFVEKTLQTMIHVSLENESYYCDLDGVMGDADFGLSLATGFRKVSESWDKLSREDIGSFLLDVAKVIMSYTPGSSGPVWGTLFMRFGMLNKGKQELSLDDLIASFQSAIEAISARGGARLGDKTLMDALNSIKESLAASKENNDSLGDALEKAGQAAFETRETTKNLMAMRGRQSFTGERSIGTYDPGIVAVGDMAVAIAKLYKGE